MRNISVGSVYGCWNTDFRATVDVVSTDYMMLVTSQYINYSCRNMHTFIGSYSAVRVQPPSHMNTDLERLSMLSLEWIV